MTQQPEWEVIHTTDCERLLRDRTGVYPPELEVADEFTNRRGKTRFLLFRVSLERMMVSPTQLELFRARPKMGYIPTLVDVIDAEGKEHRPWFEDQMHDSKRTDVHCIVQNHSAFCPVCGHWISFHLSEAAHSAGMLPDELRKLFCSAVPQELAMAYSIIGGHFGWENFDGYPLMLTEGQLKKRWK